MAHEISLKDIFISDFFGLIEIILYVSLNIDFAIRPQGFAAMLAEL